MKIAALAIAAVATFSPLVSGQFARVHNNCNFNAYVQSVPYDGSPAGDLTTLAKGGIFQEPYEPSGSTVKMGTLPGLRAPLQLGYSRSDNPSQVYYELNNRFGNPFGGDRVRVDASRQGCPAPNCGPNSPNCYSGPGRSKVSACGRPTNVTVTLCAAS